MKNMCQISARVPEESKEQLDALVEAYRAQIQVGKISQGDVIADIIKKAYEQFLKAGKLKKPEGV